MTSARRYRAGGPLRTMLRHALAAPAGARRRPGAARALVRAVSAPRPPLDAAAAGGVRSALRRLAGYVAPQPRALRARGRVDARLRGRLRGGADPGRLVASQAISDGLPRARDRAARGAGSRRRPSLRAVLRFLSRTLVFNAAREIEYELRNDLFAHLQRLPQSFFFRWRTGDLMSRCVNDLNAVRLLLGPALLNR